MSFKFNFVLFMKRIYFVLKIFPNSQIQRPPYLLNPLTPTSLAGPAEEEDMFVLGEGSHTLDLHTVPADAGPDYAAIMWSACALLGLMTCLTVCVCGVRATRR